MLTHKNTQGLIPFPFDQMLGKLTEYLWEWIIFMLLS